MAHDNDYTIVLCDTNGEPTGFYGVSEQNLIKAYKTARAFVGIVGGSVEVFDNKSDKLVKFVSE